MSCSYCPTQCSHSLHFILSHPLTISLSYLFVHSIFIILILVWLFDFEYLFLLICLVTKFWPTYSLISIIYPHISLSLSCTDWSFLLGFHSNFCMHAQLHIYSKTNQLAFSLFSSNYSLLHLPLKWTVNSTLLLWTSDNEIQYKDLVLTLLEL